jgi:hypothetical protein
VSSIIDYLLLILYYQAESGIRICEAKLGLFLVIVATIIPPAEAGLCSFDEATNGNLL